MGCGVRSEGWRCGWPGSWVGVLVVKEGAKGSDGLELGISGFGGDVREGSGQEINGME